MKKTYLTFSLSILSALSLSSATALASNSMAGHANIDMSYKVLVSEHEAYEEEAFQFVSDLSDRGIQFLANSSLDEEQRIKEFQTLLKDYFDLKTIGKFTLGRYWKSATEEQKKEYFDLFEDMVVKMYARRFGEYNGQEIVIKKAAMANKDALVSSQIVDGNLTVQVDWRVRKKNGKLKVIDVIVEGVSMSLTQRSDFSSVIQRGGGNVSVLLDHLRSK